MSKKVKNRKCTIPQIFGFRPWFEKNFGDCCAEHDKDYIEQKVTQLEADQKLRNCMRERGFPVLANLTYYGFLRPFGWIWWRT